MVFFFISRDYYFNIIIIFVCIFLVFNFKKEMMLFLFSLLLSICVKGQKVLIGRARTLESCLL